ncbi:MAG: DUF1890 domain-containing protein [Methanotrichaceae archaeon]|nr:DUF1890 domain-containing protein [Methanotrichaceae archaeon]
MDGNKSALLMMGCPEVPVQMGIVLYLSNKLGKAGYDVTVAGTDAALKLLKVSDPDEHYVKKTMEIDQCIADIVEKKIDFDCCFAFMHSDAGMTYAATMSAISKAKMYAVIFGNNAEDVAETIEFPAEKIVAKAVHNPIPLKNKIDRAIP